MKASKTENHFEMVFNNRKPVCQNPVLTSLVLLDRVETSRPSFLVPDSAIMSPK